MNWHMVCTSCEELLQCPKCGHPKGFNCITRVPIPDLRAIDEAIEYSNRPGKQWGIIHTMLLGIRAKYSQPSGA